MISATLVCGSRGSSVSVVTKLRAGRKIIIQSWEGTCSVAFLLESSVLVSDADIT